MMITLEIARVIRVGFLQQNAFHQEDTCVPMEKQFEMMEIILYLYEKSKALISAVKGIINKKKDKTQEFATGGFPEDGLFYANHSELVGKFSNGKTAVANNEQIIKGIQRGVAQGIQDAGFNNQSSTTEMRGDIRIDGKKAGTYLAKSVGKELNRAGWKLRTT